jgi:hypothetical protein
MERGLMMLVHAVIIGVGLYFLMTLVLKQSPAIAEDRSILLAGLALVYMVLFGHGPPGMVNPNLWPL